MRIPEPERIKNGEDKCLQFLTTQDPLETSWVHWTMAELLQVCLLYAIKWLLSLLVKRGWVGRVSWVAWSFPPWASLPLQHNMYNGSITTVGHRFFTLGPKYKEVHVVVKWIRFVYWVIIWPTSLEQLYLRFPAGFIKPVFS